MVQSNKMLTAFNPGITTKTFTPFLLAMNEYIKYGGFFLIVIYSNILSRAVNHS